MGKVIGIDIGGTKINGGIIDEAGNIIRRTSKETTKSGNAIDVLETLSSVIDELISDEVLGIGIGAPGFIDSNEGKVLTVGGNIQGWAETDIKGYLSKKYNVKIQVENDANVAALCESWLGSGEGMDSFVMLTIGTGLGGGIFLKESGILRGAHYQAGELGHSILHPRGHKCSCGQKGCVEMYVSGTAIESHYFKMRGLSLSGKEILDSYNNDEIAKVVIDNFTFDLSTFIISLKNIFDPEGIIIGGGVIDSKEVWWDNFILSFSEGVNDSANIKILPAKFRNDSGMIGAAKAIFDIL